MSLPLAVNLRAPVDTTGFDVDDGRLRSTPDELHPRRPPGRSAAEVKAGSCPRDNRRQPGLGQMDAIDICVLTLLRKTKDP